MMDKLTALPTVVPKPSLVAGLGLVIKALTWEGDHQDWGGKGPRDGKGWGELEWWWDGSRGPSDSLCGNLCGLSLFSEGL